jgi:hypothetical protein
MHIVWPRRSVPLIGEHSLTPFSGNGGAKFWKKLKNSGTQTLQAFRQQSCTPLGQ